MTMKAHTIILHNFWTSTHREEASPFPPVGATGQRGIWVHELFNRIS